MLSFSSKKKTAVRPRLSCDAMQRGAICWQVILEDSNQNTDCYLGASIDTIVLIEEHSRQIVFVTPCVSVLGWHAQTNRYALDSSIEQSCTPTNSPCFSQFEIVLSSGRVYHDPRAR